MRGSARTKLWASSAVVACPTKMSSGTLKRFTPYNSLGTFRIRLLWETSIIGTRGGRAVHQLMRFRSSACSSSNSCSARISARVPARLAPL